MIRKYASLESAQVLDLKGSRTRAKTASLEKIGEFEDYRTEDGFLYARIRAISSRVNKNHDGWPSVELAGGKEVFERHAGKTAGFTVTASKEDSYGFSTFLGKPVFVDHNNSNPDRARGVIVDAKLHVEDHRTAAHDPYYSSDDVDREHIPPTWVELLLEVDAKSFPKLAQAIIDGADDSKKGIDGFSMGCDVEKSVCNICKNAATSPEDFCNHVKLKGAEFDWINPKTGRKQSKRSYENCYGIKFFEISAVFDPADETALVREVRASVNKEAAACHACGGSGYLPSGQQCSVCESTGQYPPPHQQQDPNRVFSPFQQTHDQIQALPTTGHPLGPATGSWNDKLGGKKHVDAWSDKRNRQYEHIKEQLMENGKSEEEAKEEAARTVNKTRSEKGETKSHVKEAEAPLPQADLMTVPEYVDTMREEETCPVCGSNMDEGHQCEVCGYVAPPEGLDNPDLGQAQSLNEPQGDTPQMDSPKDMEQQLTQVGTPNPSAPNNLAPVASVKNDMAWQIHHPKLAGKINPVERPIRPDTTPGTNEPAETIISDQDKPVTNRTAASMIAAVNQGEHMSNARTAADAPTADTRSDKRVDVTDVGGVLSPSNEEASKPEGPHSWEDKGTTTDVTGKGGIIEDSNQEASRPSQGTESLPTADPSGDDAGFNKKKNIPDQHTQTFPNTNEPNSAVTDKAFPTANTHRAYDDSPYPSEQEELSGGKAKQGTEPVDPVGKADDRVDVKEHVTSPENNSGPTKTWTGTGGNGVTRQQDPVTPGTLEGDDIVNLKKSFVQILKIADTEVSLGMIDESEKYDRIAELEEASNEEIQATAKVLARVKTAGLKKNASVKQGGVGRVPSFRSASTPATPAGREVDESLFW